MEIYGYYKISGSFGQKTFKDIYMLPLHHEYFGPSPCTDQ